MTGRVEALGRLEHYACLDTRPSMAFADQTALTTRPDLMHAVQAWM